MKVMTIVGTRPEIIKLSTTIKELDKYTEHILVHTGQNYDYELNEIFFKDLGLREPDVYMNAAGENAAETIGNVIIKSDELIKKYQPRFNYTKGGHGDNRGVNSVNYGRKRPDVTKRNKINNPMHNSIVAQKLQ